MQCFHLPAAGNNQAANLLLSFGGIPWLSCAAHTLVRICASSTTRSGLSVEESRRLARENAKVC